MKICILFLILLNNAFSYERIISTVPSLTESLVGLGLSKQIVGVSRYCTFSISECNKPKVGSSIDINYEKILELRPDVVILSSSSKKESINNLRKLKIKVLTFRHERAGDVISTLEMMGRIFKKEKESKKMISTIRDDFKSSLGSFKDIKVFLVIGSSIKDGEVVSAHVAGSKNFYNDLFEEMGIDNIYSSSNISFPQLDRERLLMSNADYVIQLFENNDSEYISKAKKSWEKLFSKTKKSTKYISLVGNYLYIPGPRIGQISIQLSKKIKESNVRSK